MSTRNDGGLRLTEKRLAMKVTFHDPPLPAAITMTSRKHLRDMLGKVAIHVMSEEEKRIAADADPLLARGIDPRRIRVCRLKGNGAYLGLAVDAVPQFDMDDAIAAAMVEGR